MQLWRTITVDIQAKNINVNDATSSGIRMSGLMDTWMTPQEQCGGISCLFLLFEEAVTIYSNCIGFGRSTVYP